MILTSVFKRTYEGIALFALLNFVVMGGLAAYLLGTGAVNSEKLQRIASVLRGEEQQESAEPVAETAEAGDETASIAPTEETAADSQFELEIIRREADRVREELRQRLALNNNILLRITTERENFRREREAAEQNVVTERGEREKEGFEKQIAILAGVKPKTAVEHLLSLGDPDEAARVLLAMDLRKAKKIVEAAKRRDQMEQMKLILRRLRDVAPGQSAALTSEE